MDSKKSRTIENYIKSARMHNDEINYQGENVMIEFGKENAECKGCFPYVSSLNEVIDDVHELNTLEITVETESGRAYKIIFESYMMYLVRNESYTSWDNYEIRHGNYFVLFKKSRLLDMVDTMLLHTKDHSYPGVGVHYGVYACDHTIDIISVNVPKIIQLHNLDTK